MGNTCLYGATGGKLFAEGTVGERFAVRNSGAIAVIEGSGDHTCEYMTGGVIVILGKTGNNFGAGMTGGLSFIYDEDNLFKNKINNQSVEIDKIMKKNLAKHQDYLLYLIKQHFQQTGSRKANKIIKNFNKEMHKFLIVKPKASNFDDLLALITSAA